MIFAVYLNSNWYAVIVVKGKLQHFVRYMPEYVTRHAVITYYIQTTIFHDISDFTFLSICHRCLCHCNSTLDGIGTHKLYPLCATLRTHDYMASQITNLVKLWTSHMTFQTQEILIKCHCLKIVPFRWDIYLWNLTKSTSKYHSQLPIHTLKYLQFIEQCRFKTCGNYEIPSIFEMPTRTIFHLLYAYSHQMWLDNPCRTECYVSKI